MRVLVLIAFACLSTPAAAFEKPVPAAAVRVFDAVAPNGAHIRFVDGSVVLRLPGERFGAVLSFTPETATTAWLPLAILNAGTEPLEVREAGLSARSGADVLKVHDNASLVRDHRKFLDQMVALGVVIDDAPPPRADITVAVNPIGNNPNEIFGTKPSQHLEKVKLVSPPGARPSNRRARAAADARMQAFATPLFLDATLEPGRFMKGDVRVDLPPARADGVPAEFVLRLAFGGQVNEVTYRERTGEAAANATPRAEP